MLQRPETMAVEHSPDSMSTPSLLPSSPEHPDIEDTRKLRKTGTNVHSAFAGISVHNALLRLGPPPPDAKIGSKHLPWLRLSEWETMILRQKMKKNAKWKPSEDMVKRELVHRERGARAYYAAKETAEREGRQVVDDDGIETGLAGREKLTRFEDWEKPNVGMKLNLAKKRKREMLDASDEGLQHSKRNMEAVSDDEEVETSVRMSLSRLTKRKRGMSDVLEERPTQRRRSEISIDSDAEATRSSPNSGNTRRRRNAAPGLPGPTTTTTLNETDDGNRRTNAGPSTSLRVGLKGLSAQAQSSRKRKPRTLPTSKAGSSSDDYYSTGTWGLGPTGSAVKLNDPNYKDAEGKVPEGPSVVTWRTINHSRAIIQKMFSVLPENERLALASKHNVPGLLLEDWLLAYDSSEDGSPSTPDIAGSDPYNSQQQANTSQQQGPDSSKTWLSPFLVREGTRIEELVARGTTLVMAMSLETMTAYSNLLRGEQAARSTTPTSENPPSPQDPTSAMSVTDRNGLISTTHEDNDSNQGLGATNHSTPKLPQHTRGVEVIDLEDYPSSDSDDDDYGNNTYDATLSKAPSRLKATRNPLDVHDSDTEKNIQPFDQPNSLSTAALLATSPFSESARPPPRRSLSRESRSPSPNNVRNTSATDTEDVRESTGSRSPNRFRPTHPTLDTPSAWSSFDQSQPGIWPAFSHDSSMTMTPKYATYASTAPSSVTSTSTNAQSPGIAKPFGLMDTPTTDTNVATLLEKACPLLQSGRDTSDAHSNTEADGPTAPAASREMYNDQNSDNSPIDSQTPPITDPNQSTTSSPQNESQPIAKASANAARQQIRTKITKHQGFDQRHRRLANFLRTGRFE